MDIITTLEILPSGIPCITTNDEAINIFGPAFSIRYNLKIANILSFTKEIVDQLKDDQKIIVIQYGLKEHLTELEYKSILAHEEGHIVLGHLDVVKTKNDYSEQDELDADQYAVQLFGVDIYKSAIDKTLNFSNKQPVYASIQQALGKKNKKVMLQRLSTRLLKL